MHTGSNARRLAETPFSRLTGDKKVNDSDFQILNLSRPRNTPTYGPLSIRTAPFDRTAVEDAVAVPVWSIIVVMASVSRYYPVVCLLFSIFLSFYISYVHWRATRKSRCTKFYQLIKILSTSKLLKVSIIVTNFYLFNKIIYVSSVRWIYC